MEMAGAIFGCTQTTVGECLRRGLFGLPAEKKRLVMAVKPGMKLFLFNHTKRELLGVFEAITSGNTFDPVAFKRQCPWQVRVRRIADCPPLSEAAFMATLKGSFHNGHTVPIPLTLEQVEDLLAAYWQGEGAARQGTFLPHALPELHGGPLELAHKRCEKTHRHVGRKAKREAVQIAELHQRSAQGSKKSRKQAAVWPTFHRETFANKDVTLAAVNNPCDKRATVALGPVPKECNVKDVIAALDMRHRRKYNFLCVKELHGEASRYCFVNLVDHNDVGGFAAHCKEFLWRPSPDDDDKTDQGIKVRFWNLQGIEDLATTFRKSGYWENPAHSPAECSQLYDGRPLFFYGAGAKFAGRQLTCSGASALEDCHMPSSECASEAGCVAGQMGEVSSKAALSGSKHPVGSRRPNLSKVDKK